MSDDNNNQSIIRSVVYGCMDEDAANYFADATDSEGVTCTYYGCFDVAALNFDPPVTIDGVATVMIDDGSCLYGITGCINSNALNYDSNATVDDGSCVLECFGNECCLYAEPDHYLLGDFNLDGSVNVTDVTQMVSFILGNVGIIAEQQCSADSNKDAHTNILDLLNAINVSVDQTPSYEIAVEGDDFKVSSDHPETTVVDPLVHTVGFNVLEPGEVAVEVAWQPQGSSHLTAKVYAISQLANQNIDVNNQPIAVATATDDDGSLNISFDVENLDWGINYRLALSTDTADLNGSFVIITPYDQTAQQHFLNAVELQDHDFLATDFLHTDAMLQIADDSSSIAGKHVLIGLDHKPDCVEVYELNKAGIHVQEVISNYNHIKLSDAAGADSNSFYYAMGLVDSDIDLANSNSYLQNLNPQFIVMKPLEKIDPDLLMENYAKFITENNQNHVLNQDGSLNIILQAHPGVILADINMQINPADVVKEISPTVWQVKVAGHTSLIELALLAEVKSIYPSLEPAILENDDSILLLIGEDYNDANNNFTYDAAAAEVYVDTNGNGSYDTGLNTNTISCAAVNVNEKYSNMSSIGVTSGYTGNNITAGIRDNNVIANPDITLIFDNPGISVNSRAGEHATHVSGIIAGDGTGSLGAFGVSWNGGASPGGGGNGVGAWTGNVAGPGVAFQWRGMAPDATVYDADMLVSATLQTATTAPSSVDVINISQAMGGASYTANAQFVDQVIRGDIEGVPAILYSYSAGNSGNNNLAVAGNTGGHYSMTKQAKNIITVGNWNSNDDDGNQTNDFLAGGSSMGPFGDGRVAPFVVAPGSGIVSRGWISNIDRDCDGDVSNDIGDWNGNGSVANCNALSLPILPSCDTNADGIRDNSEILACYTPRYETMGGTSMASPLVTGTLANMLEAYEKTYLVPLNLTLDDARPIPALLKAIIANTADDIDSSVGTFTTGIDVKGGGVNQAEITQPAGAACAAGVVVAPPGPDYATGFGMLDPNEAVAVMLDSRDHYGITIPNRFIQDTIVNQEIKEHTFEIDQTWINTNSLLQITLAWDDLASTTSTNTTAIQLTNDLEFVLIDPDGNIFYPSVLGHQTFYTDPADSNVKLMPADAQQVNTAVFIDLPDRVDAGIPAAADNTQINRPAAGSNLDTIPCTVTQAGGIWTAMPGRDHINTIEQITLSNSNCFGGVANWTMVDGNAINTTVGINAAATTPLAASLLPGEYTMRVSGFNIDNTQGPQSFAIAGFPYADLADIVVQADTRVALAGAGNYDIDFTVTNTGPVTSGVATNYTIWLSTDFNVDASDVAILQSAATDINILLPAVSQSFKITVPITDADAVAVLGAGTTVADLAANDVFLIIEADASDSVIEHNDNNIAVAQIARLADIVFVIDTSGSMGWDMTVSTGDRLKIDLLKESANLALDLMRLDAGDRVGLVEFNNEATIIQELANITTANLDATQQLHEGLDAEGGTNIHEALEKALMLFDDDSGRREIVILMSDGEKTVGADPAALIDDYTDAGVQIFSVGFGDPDDIDVLLLQNLSNSTAGGFYQLANVAFGLDKFFVNAMAGAMGDEVLVDPVAIVDAGDINVMDVLVTKMDSDIKFIVTTDSPTHDLDVYLEAPNGLFLKESNYNQFGSDINYKEYGLNNGTAGNTHYIYDIKFPIAGMHDDDYMGQWKVYIENNSDDGIKYSTSTIGQSLVHVAVENPTPDSGESYFTMGEQIELSVIQNSNGTAIHDLTGTVDVIHKHLDGSSELITTVDLVSSDSLDSLSGRFDTSIEQEDSRGGSYELLYRLNGILVDCDGEFQREITQPILIGEPGCTNPHACNYDASASFNNGSCGYPETNFDCDGNCISDIDCAGECGGSAVYDGCGVCDGEGDCAIPDLFHYNQSQLQAFYYFSEVTIDDVQVETTDWVGVFNGDVCVGHVNTCGESQCVVAAMGDNGQSDTLGYLTPEDFPSFKIYDTSEDIYYDAVASEEVAWSNFGFFNIDNLKGILVHGCTNTSACNYNDAATNDDGSCSFFDCFGVCGGSGWDCGDGECILEQLVCDGSTEFCNASWGPDCANGADEGLDVCDYEDECATGTTCAKTDCGSNLAVGYSCEQLIGWGYDCSLCEAAGNCDAAPPSCADQGLWDCGDGQCINETYVCDGSTEFCNADEGPDCKNGADEGLDVCGYEDHCTTQTCEETDCGGYLDLGYTCDVLVNDYGIDCSACQEEGKCDAPPSSCADQGLWDCGDGQCINEAYVCDGSDEFCNAGWGADCANGADEGLDNCDYTDDCVRDCTAELACNYNPDADFDDDSCVYPDPLTDSCNEGGGGGCTINCRDGDIGDTLEPILQESSDAIDDGMDLI